MFGNQARPGAPGRRTLRERKVSQRIAVVDESTRKKATQERLDAYEADNEAGEDAGPAGSDDDEFVIAGQDEDEEDEEVEISGKRKKKKASGGMATKRKLRTGGAAPRVPRTFARLVEEASLERLPANTPSYLTASVGPPLTGAPRKFCSVCGGISSYKCSRCGSLYCSRKCHTTHAETRCLKLIT